MGHNDNIDFELADAISDLTDEGLLDEGTPAFGIAQQVIHTGYDSLTDKQKYVYDRLVLPALERRAIQIRIDEIKSSNPE